MTYCAFVICALLGDWSCIDLPRALSYIQRCRVRVSTPSFDLKTLIRNVRARAHTRRTKADTDRRQRASRSADRRTARSRRCTSSQPTTHVRPRRAYDAPNGTRRCAGCCTRRRSPAAALRGARTSWRMRVTDSGVGPLSPYEHISLPLLFRCVACVRTH